VLSGPTRPGAGRLILLVTSPRVAPGLLSWPAWEALRGAARVLADSADHPQLAALADAGIQTEIGPAGDPGLPELARFLAETAAQADGPDGPDGPVVWLAGERADDLLGALRELAGGGPATTILHGSADLPGARLLDLVATMEILRAECPWDAKQTHESLAPHLLEEPYEALEALESGDYAALREELGDVLLQVVFHAQVASERDDGTGFTVDDVADGIVTKLVRRHPHVFAGVTVSGADEVKQNWDAIKKAERAERALPGDAPSSALDGVPFAQPALALAAQLQRRAARAGVPEEIVGQTGAELGDRLFALVAAARAAGLDPELELRSAARRFSHRVRAWEQDQPGVPPQEPAE
jgi:XTP/dITP diphosphohydrolase